MNLRISTQGLYRQGVDAMQKQTQALAKVQGQLASNQRMGSAADDPVGAGRALKIDRALADTLQWNGNIGAAQDRLNLEESALAGANDALARIRELAIRANAGTLSDGDRQSVAAEINERVRDLMDQANARDGQGNYLFAGSRTRTTPFQFVGGQAQYQGDTLGTSVAIGSNRSIAMNDTGDEVFMSVPSGDGRLDVAAGAANTGVAQVSSVGFTDSSQWDGGSYTVRLAGGSYSVVDAGGNAVAGGAYQAGDAIQFRGVSLTLSGTPADGDSFTLGASQPQSVFATAQKIAGLVAGYGRTAAQSAQDQTALYSTLQSLDTAMSHLSNVRGGVGARLNVLDDASTQLQARSAHLQQSLSDLREVDYTAATAQMSQTQTVLQAAQQSYLKVQGLSLFDYMN